MKYEVVIGLEVHSELATKSKIFCGCANEFGGEPNSKCCPICTGMPGVLPVLNKTVVDYAIKAGLSTNCEITKYGKQDRKNYFYPDLPKAYQISQFDLPLCKNGYLDVEADGQRKRIGITRIHIEEDAGKLLHDAYDSSTLMDSNRCGVPLIEIVSEPDMRSPEEARAYLEAIKSILQYIGVSDCKMEEGSLRCDINISIRPFGQAEFGTRTEMKNVNSFRAAVRAMEYEISRQIDVVESGGTIIQQTLRWDDARGVSIALRSKEDAHDYRYFPDPDLMPIVVDDAWIDRLKAQLPELPKAKLERYINEFGLSEFDAGIISSQKAMADFFEAVIREGAQPKPAANWLMGDIAKLLNDKGIEADQISFTPTQLAKMIALIDKGTISNNAGKRVIAAMFENPKDPEQIVADLGLAQVSDEGALAQMVQEILVANPQSVADYKSGKAAAVGFLVGQAMKASKGKGNPQIINKLLKEALDN